MNSKSIRVSPAAYDNLQRRVRLSDPLGSRTHTVVLVDRVLFECPDCPHQYECLVNQHRQCVKGDDMFEARC